MINNLQVTTENIGASESRIRDTDMAMEMVSFTKFQVLQQAGTAMLSQANQVPQSILSLLR
jgi:flagellin